MSYLLQASRLIVWPPNSIENVMFAYDTLVAASETAYDNQIVPNH